MWYSGKNRKFWKPDVFLSSYEKVGIIYLLSWCLRLVLSNRLNRVDIPQPFHLRMDTDAVSKDLCSRIPGGGRKSINSLILKWETNKQCLCLP